jgi:hypothetical protein
MNAPLYSTISLIAELFVSAIVYYTLYQGYKKNNFPTRLAFGALTYEILFNISYMVYRVMVHTETTPESGFEVLVAIVHGILSLVMFVSLIAFFVYAWKKYRQGINFFFDHPVLTKIFGFFWAISVFSGILFYCLEYL